jgi:uncharacterized protein
MVRRTALVAAVLAGLVLMIRWLEPRLVFFPLRGEQATPEGRVAAWESLDIHTRDGETLRAWWLPHPDAAADIVYFHGNGGNLSVWLPVLLSIRAQGVNVLAVDYRGYGDSTGSPTEAGLYADADASVLRHQAFAAATRPVIYWGRSLGGPVAAYAATVGRPDALILEATFPDKAAVLRGHPVLQALNLFGRYEFPTGRFLTSVHAPVLVLHGDADTVIPYDLGRELYAGLTGTKQFVTLRRGDHNDVHGPDDEDYWTPIRAFIRGVGQPTAGDSQ